MENTGAVLCIFGATGDLAAKKILPALQQWYEKECPFARIWCLGRRPLDNTAYHTFVEEKGAFQLSEQLKEIIGYHRLDFDDTEAYRTLENRLRDEGFVPQGRRLFFLAVKPDAFVTITANLQAAALFTTGDLQHRLLFEKPFGESRESAVAIQTLLMELASEEQVYRIDHYLGKEMIRNILTIRFANRIFSESWHGGAIDTVVVTSIETAGVAERLEYYDRAGAINDMVQSHLLQMVALVAMAAPDNLEPESIRRGKIDVLKHIDVDPQQLPVIGQYEGYAEQIPGSTTETYVKAQLRIDTPQWQGTRFIVTTGKKLGEKRTEIRLHFRPNNLCVSCDETIEAAANQLVIEVFPQEGMQLQFNSKVPGYDYEIEQVTADYCHSCRTIGNKPEAYIKLIKDTLDGDKTLFASFDELLAQWRIADRIQAKALEGKLIIYPTGSVQVNNQGGDA